ncbi:MAG: molecular chaperone DnaK, partial [Chloroflexi bacterium]|nr:molecular chaperone DnaK [Chloroflexota bacterium]
TEKLLKELGDKVPPTDRGTIEQSVQELKRAKDGNDTAKIRELIEQLKQASYALGQQVYAQQQTAGGAGSPQPDRPASGGDDDVVEGEFREA